MSWIGQAVRILRKDLQIEWRGKARALALATFAGILLLLFSFAIGPDTRVLQKHAAAYIWLAVLTASTLSLAQSFRTETEHGALEGLRLLPVDPRGLYYGKAMANWLVLVGLTAVLLPMSLVLFDLSIAESPLKLVAVLLLGCGGIAAPGTMYSALTARTGAQQLMLPVLLFPLLVPALLAAVKALGFVLLGDPMDQIGSWLMLLLCFDLVFWSLGGVLFGYLIEQ